MKPLQSYNKETVSKLKRWISAVQSRGHEQYYEIFVDGIKVIHKTSDTKEFESYLMWVDEDTQVIKVLTYNTKGSHRSKVFEFRTNKFVDKVNYKDQVEVLESENGDLLKRIADAEEHISNLETQLEQQTKKPAFDIESIISKFGGITQQNPDLLGNITGLSEILKVKRDETKHEDSVGENAENIVTFSTSANISEAESKQIKELVDFFVNNPAYVCVVYDLVIKEKEKMAA